MNVNRMVRALIIAVLASALVYAALIVLSDGSEFLAAVRDFDVAVLGLILVLSTGSYVIRSLRWGLLMRSQGFPVSWRDALYLHMSGQTMSVSPGRVGEVLKPWLSREVTGMPMARGLALVFAERVADLIAVCILAIGGLSALGGGLWALLAALGAIVAGTVVASSAWFHRLALGMLSKQGWASKHADSLHAISQTVRRSLSWRSLAWSVPFSFVAWGLEGVGFSLALHELGFGRFGVVTAVSVYAVATIVGAFTFLPGGIGLTEASMDGILVAAGMQAAPASAATLLTRVATLWWAVLLGWAMLLTRPALFRRLLGKQDADADSEPGSDTPAVD